MVAMVVDLGVGGSCFDVALQCTSKLDVAGVEDGAQSADLGWNQTWHITDCSMRVYLFTALERSHC